MIVCRKFQHAIWPAQVQSYFQGPQHRMKSREAAPIAETAQSWPYLIQYSVELYMPIRIDSPVRILPVYSDGLLCEIEPIRFQYICRNEDSMRMHSKQKHRWSAQARRGRPSKIFASNPTPKPWRIVICQRFFVHGQGSHFIEIVNAGSASRTNARVGISVQSQAQQTMSQAMMAVKEKERRMMKRGSGWKCESDDLGHVEVAEE